MAKRQPQRRRRQQRAARMVFDRRNYQLLLGAVSLIAVGFALMRIENEVDGFISLYLSPIMIMAGYIGVLYAILWRPRTAPADEAEPSAGSSAQSRLV